MQEKWQKYVQQLRKQTLVWLVCGTPLTGLFFTVLNALTSDGKRPLTAVAAECFTYAISIGLWMCLLYSMLWALAVRGGPKRIAALRKSVPSYLVLSFFGLCLGIYSAELLLAWHYRRSMPDSLSLLQSLMVGGLISTGLTFFHAYRLSETEVRSLATKTIEAQYATLKSQMQPHFLFNSLNSLSALIEENPEKATLMTEQLATLYRSILANSKEKTSLLQTELAIVRTYLDLERIRFGTRLHYEIDTAGLSSLEPVYVPSLMLQTLVENAVKHGIAPAIGGGRIELKVSHLRPGAVRIEIRNSGNPYEPRDNAGTGLVNTKQRLDLLYGDLHSFQIGQIEGGDTQVAFIVTGAHFV